MIPEFGLIAFIASLALQLLFIVAMLLGFKQKLQNLNIDSLISQVTLAISLLTLLSLVALGYSFFSDDFSVLYVANHSNTNLEFGYKISAIWGGHEGSMLLWFFVATLWQKFYLTKAKLPLSYKTICASVIGLTILLMGLFIALTSNPFERILPVPQIQGNDLNPLLQDIGLIFHPPMLYIGYVGLIIPFAIGLTAMILQWQYRDWRQFLQPWVNMIWAFLTAGIGLGSWWAYRELGWGGWWFWDPVENVSLMPWILITVLIHWTNKRSENQIYGRIVPLLTILPFFLVLLGLFTVRSGLLTSVHSFANSPERGLYLLLLMALILVCSMFFYSRRKRSKPTFFPLSLIDWLLIIQGVSFLTMTTVVLVGTYYPLFYEVFNLGFVSVGAPYFNQFMSILILPTLMALPIVVWQQISVVNVHKIILISTALILAILLKWYLLQLTLSKFSVPVFIGIYLGFWGLLQYLYYAVQLIRKTKKLTLLKHPQLTMIAAHLAISLLILAISANQLSNSKEVLLTQGESFALGQYQIGLKSIEYSKMQNYMATIGQFEVSKNSQYITQIQSEKRQYQSGTITTEAGVSSQFWGNIYITIGHVTDQGFSVRLQLNPMVLWIWLSIIVLFVTGFVRLLQQKQSSRN